MKEQVKFSIRLDADLKAELEDYAWEHRMSYTEALGVMVRTFLDEEKKKQAEG